MSDFGPLAYLEWRQLINRFKLIVRQPARAILYVVVLGYLVFLAIVRIYSRGFYGSYSSARFAMLPEPYASALLFAFVALIGIVAYGAASGIAGTFSSPADARFLCGSRLSERSVVIWLQLRRSAWALFRMLFSVFILAIIYIRSGSFGGIGLTALGGTLLVTGAAIPVLKLRAVRGARAAQTLGAALVAIGLLPVAILISSLMEPHWLPWTHAIERLGAGSAVHALVTGNALALAALYAAAIALLVTSFACGTNLYPELYSASLRLAEYRSRRRRPSAMFVSEHTYRRQSDVSGKFFEGLRGAWTIAWKEWIAFMRSSSLRRMFIIGAIACVFIGVVFGRIALRERDPLGASLNLGASAGNALVILVAFASSVGLAADLRKPMWWIGPDSLWMRLFAWTLATSFRMAICLGLGLIAWAAVLHSAILVAVGIPAALAAVVYLRATGLALYAINPYGFDQRGPMAMLRVLLTYLFAIPPIVAAVVAWAIFDHSPGAGMAAGIAVAIAEALLLITFSAARIAGRGAAFAQGETA